MFCIAVLGCGSIGSRHLRNLQILGYRSLVGFDPNPAVCEQIRTEIGVACFDTLDEVWARSPRVTLVTSPSNQHVSQAHSAALHDSHLFIEKPVSHSFEGLDLLCDEVSKRNLVAMVGCNMRFHPGPAQVKKLLLEGRIGTIVAARIKTGSYLPRWRPWQDYRQSYSASREWGGAVLDCVHEIDLAQWFFGRAEVVGSSVVSAHAIGLETDGLAEILLKHDTNVLCSVHVNYIQHNYRKSCEIIGTAGTIYWDFTAKQVTVFGADGQASELFPEPEDWQINQMYLDEMSHFFSAIEERRPSMNPLAEASSSLGVCLQVRETGVRVGS